MLHLNPHTYMHSLVWPDQFFLLHGEGKFSPPHAKERIGLATQD